jgi:hypothetical protein
MSIDSDGILFFGIDLGVEEDLDLPWDEEYDGDWEQMYYAKMREKFTEKYPEKDYNDDIKMKAYFAAKKELEDNGSMIGVHCSFNHSMLYVAVSESNLVAYRGSPKKVKSFEIKPDWIQKIKDFCELMEIEYQEPRWILTSLYG